MRVVVLHPYTKFEVRRPCQSENMAHDACDLEPGESVKPLPNLMCESYLRWGTCLPDLGTLGLWVLELFAMYATDRQTDGRTDKSNAYCPFPVGAVGNNHNNNPNTT